MQAIESIDYRKDNSIYCLGIESIEMGPWRRREGLGGRSYRGRVPSASVEHNTLSASACIFEKKNIIETLRHMRAIAECEYRRANGHKTSVFALPT